MRDVHRTQSSFWNGFDLRVQNDRIHQPLRNRPRAGNFGIEPGGDIVSGDLSGLVGLLARGLPRSGRRVSRMFRHRFCWPRFRPHVHRPRVLTASGGWAARPGRPSPACRARSAREAPRRPHARPRTCGDAGRHVVVIVRAKRPAHLVDGTMNLVMRLVDSMTNLVLGLTKCSMHLSPGLGQVLSGFAVLNIARTVPVPDGSRPHEPTARVPTPSKPASPR